LVRSGVETQLASRKSNRPHVNDDEWSLVASS
jgi:hypothetical protein